MGKVAEAEAMKLWTLKTDLEELNLPTLTGTSTSVGHGTIDAATLGQQLTAAWSGFPKNPHPNQFPAQVQTWESQSPPKVATAIAEAVNNALIKSAQQTATFLTQIDTPLKQYGGAVSEFVRKAIKQATTTVLAQERRNEILWWKETLYSQSRNRGYRGLNPAEAAVLTALDLHLMLKLPVAPQSVDYLLRETVRSALSPRTEQISLADFAVTMERDEHKLDLPSLLSANIPAGRCSLLDFLTGVLLEKWQSSALRIQTGITPTRTMPAEEIAVIIFHDLQTRRLV
jgi:hypothetical protein